MKRPEEEEERFEDDDMVVDGPDTEESDLDQKESSDESATEPEKGLTSGEEKDNTIMRKGKWTVSQYAVYFSRRRILDLVRLRESRYLFLL